MNRMTSANAPAFRVPSVSRDPGSMPYVRVAPGGRYFMTEDNSPFLAVGHNDAMPWPGMYNLRGESDTATTEKYIKDLVEHGVNVMRIMLEYGQDRHWYFEKPLGRPQPDMVLYWDDLIGLCERHGLRLLVLFWDTFFLSRRWKYHPYSKPGTGFDGPWSMCTSPRAMEHEKDRIAFFIDRWGDSPAIFGYDLFNEIHPHWGGTPEEQFRWVAEMAHFVRERELARWGRRHLLTVSFFGHEPEPAYAELLFRHPDLDFATTHVYQAGPSDDIGDTLVGARLMRRAVSYACENIRDNRPYMDTESGPIFSYMHTRKRPGDDFEAEYYHNMSWGHLATGGAGSGMRWPFRDPHTLSPAMHDVLLGMSRFIRGCNLDWTAFSPTPADGRLIVSGPPGEQPEIFGCASNDQALVWVVRAGAVSAGSFELVVSGLAPGEYHTQLWETYDGVKLAEISLEAPEGRLYVPLTGVQRDIAVSLRRAAAPELEQLS